MRGQAGYNTRPHDQFLGKDDLKTERSLDYKQHGLLMSLDYFFDLVIHG